MTDLDKLNKILPDIFLRMETDVFLIIRRRVVTSKVKESYCYINLTNEELSIIHRTHILQFFGYRLEFKSDIDHCYYDGKLLWCLE